MKVGDARVSFFRAAGSAEHEVEYNGKLEFHSNDVRLADTRSKIDFRSLILLDNDEITACCCDLLTVDNCANSCSIACTDL